MKKNNKKLLVIIGTAVLVILFLIFLFIKSSNSKIELTLSEKKWIEDNKESMIDVYIMNDLPVFSSDENDIFLSYLNYFEAETGLSLNKVSYSMDSSLPSSNYLFKIYNFKFENIYKSMFQTRKVI